MIKKLFNCRKLNYQNIPILIQNLTKLTIKYLKTIHKIRVNQTGHHVTTIDAEKLPAIVGMTMSEQGLNIRIRRSMIIQKRRKSSKDRQQFSSFFFSFSSLDNLSIATICPSFFSLSSTIKCASHHHHSHVGLLLLLLLPLFRSSSYRRRQPLHGW